MEDDGIFYILWPFGIFNGFLIYFTAIWYILWLISIPPHFGKLCNEKSGNSDEETTEKNRKRIISKL
jgi:hypothetical protein